MDRARCILIEAGAGLVSILVSWSVRWLTLVESEAGKSVPVMAQHGGVSRKLRFARPFYLTHAFNESVDIGGSTATPARITLGYLNWRHAMTIGQSTDVGRRKIAHSNRRPKRRATQLWRVILHNDDVNTATFVLDRVVQLTPLLEDDAVEKVLEAHDTGQSLLLTTHRERAELYEEQFRCFRIRATAEPS